jgi:acetyl-CoA synthetase
VCYNAVDRHLESKGDKTAILWEGNDGESTAYTYSALHVLVCKFANVLKSKGAKKGDRVSIYMPMVPELAIAMLACARIGVVHSVV